MIDYLQIKNFKCFTEIKIPINGLTVMAGANGNGKSTAIQALLLLRKTIEENYRLYDGYFTTQKEEIDADISLNSGYLLNLGNSSLVTNRLLGKSDITIGMSNEKQNFFIEYKTSNTGSDLYIKAYKVSSFVAAFLPLLKQEFYYLNAERIGPRANQQIRYYDFPNTGFQGENLAQMIADTNYKMEIDRERRHSKSGSPRLEQQLNVWLDDLMPGVRISAIQSLSTLTAQIQVENFFTKSNPTLATNIGFGISYVLPILASGLIAAKNSYLIVENPEAHLHPSAQSKIGRFLAMVANSGVRVVIETHSDHVINGIQIAVAKSEVPDSLTTINFFSQNEQENQPLIENIKINEKGELSSWPRGFFDQSQVDHAELFKLRRS